jgi:large subunit ribosomal protein L18
VSRATTRIAARKRRHTSIRMDVAGDAKRPRLAIFRSLNHIYAQVIDDQRGATLAAASTLDAAAKGDAKMTKVQEAAAVGTLIGERAKVPVLRRWSLTAPDSAITGASRRLQTLPGLPGLSFRRAPR